MQNVKQGRRLKSQHPNRKGRLRKKPTITDMCPGNLPSAAESSELRVALLGRHGISASAYQAAAGCKGSNSDIMLTEKEDVYTVPRKNTAK
jgi:hypothetical protein